jgi:Undecaprenyl-phosphate galactose phosphotransferase WbaP
MATVRSPRARKLLIPSFGFQRPADIERESEELDVCARHLAGTQYLLRNLLTSLPLAVADITALLLALAVAHAVEIGFDRDLSDVFHLQFGALATGLLLANFGLGLYPGIGLGSTTESGLTARSATLLCGVSWIVGMLHDGGHFAGNWVLATLWIALVSTLPMARRLTRRLSSRTSWWSQPVLILGGDAEGAQALTKMLATPEQGLRPVGVLDDLPDHWSDDHVDPQWYRGPLDAAVAIARDRGVYWGVINMSRFPGKSETAVVDRFSTAIPHLIVLRDIDTTAPRLWNGAHELGALCGARYDVRLLLPLPRLTKRLADLMLTIVGGLLILPILLLIAAAVKLSSRGPVFYSQERLGQDGRRFRAWKFRTMVPNADAALAEYLRKHPEMQVEWAQYHKLKVDPRVTSVGRWLRKTSLDELPQLWNVLMGEMSLVGPRPIVNAEIVKYGPAFAMYESVVPGITGLWQVSGRNNTSYEQRIDFDQSYIRNWSLRMDAQILLATIDVVLRRRGAY